MFAVMSPVPRHVMMVMVLVSLELTQTGQGGGLGNMIKLLVLDPNALSFQSLYLSLFTSLSLRAPVHRVQSRDDMGLEELPAWRLRSEALGMPGSSLPNMVWEPWASAFSGTSVSPYVKGNEQKFRS